MDISKTNDHIQINIKMPNPSQEPPASSKAPNEDFKDMDVMGTFKIKIESQNLDHGYIKDQGPYRNQDQKPNPSQEPPASSKAPNEDLKDMDVLCTFQIELGSQILNMGIRNTNDHIKIKIKMPNPSQEHPASSKASNKDLKDMDVLCTFKFKIESQNLDHG